MSTEITPRSAANVLFNVGKGGSPGSGFIIRLLEALPLADEPHLARLAHGFPGLVAAWRLAHDPDGIARLRELAEQEEGWDEPIGQVPEFDERIDYGTRWTGFDGGRSGAPLAVQISHTLNEQHAREHAADIRGWQTQLDIPPDAEPVSRITVHVVSTPWRPLPAQDAPQGNSV